MINDMIFHVIIPFSYLIIVLVIKKNLWDKKYNERKSSMIADVLNSLALLYFLFLKDVFLTMMFTFYMMTRYNYYKKNQKVKSKK